MRPHPPYMRVHCRGDVSEQLAMRSLMTDRDTRPSLGLSTRVLLRLVHHLCYAAWRVERPCHLLRTHSECLRCQERGTHPCCKCREQERWLLLFLFRF